MAAGKGEAGAVAALAKRKLAGKGKKAFFGIAKVCGVESSPARTGV